ncbi:MAG: hypothetical protein ACFFBI_07710 [Promethearchaeota archaeon]
MVDRNILERVKVFFTQSPIFKKNDIIVILTAVKQLVEENHYLREEIIAEMEKLREWRGMGINIGEFMILGRLFSEQRRPSFLESSDNMVWFMFQKGLLEFGEGKPDDNQVANKKILEVCSGFNDFAELLLGNIAVENLSREEPIYFGGDVVDIGEHYPSIEAILFFDEFWFVPMDALEELVS